jgi:phosphoribosyl-AMP cyclohydrolase
VSSPRGSAAEIEEGLAFAPRFDAAGLIACVVTAIDTGEVLMVAHMNAEALAKTLATGEAWYYSRSRQALWKKGESSGHIQRVVEMRVDCDQDVLLLKVEQAGAGACHTGRRTCFYRVVVPGMGGAAAALEFRDAERGFDPAKVYGAGKTREG